MYATIRITPYIHVQGPILRRLPDGMVAVSHAGREIIGEPTRPELVVDTRG